MLCKIKKDVGCHKDYFVNGQWYHKWEIYDFFDLIFMTGLGFIVGCLFTFTNFKL